MTYADMHLCGVYAFAFLSTVAQYARALAASEEGLRIDPLDVWSQHAIAHVFYERAQLHEGIAW
jgi:hypothetical protein